MISTKLIFSPIYLECSENIALCLANLLESHAGSHNLLKLKNSSDMISQLVGLFCSDDNAKSVLNACYALNNLCARDAGLGRVLSHPSCEQMTQKLLKVI